MFGLAEQVGGHDLRAAFAIGNHQNLTGAGHHVNAHLAKHLLLCLRHKLVAGTHNFIYLGDALRAVGQSGHRLGAPHPKHPVHPADPGRRQDVGGNLPIFPRRGHHADLLYPGQLGGDAVHQHAGGIGGGAAGDVEPHPRQGEDLLPHEDAVLLIDQKAVADLVLVEGGDSLGGPIENLHQKGVRAAEALVHRPGAHLQGGEFHPVKRLGILLQRLVPPGFHLGQNGPDRFLHRVHRVLPGKDLSPVGLRFL